MITVFALELRLSFAALIVNFCKIFLVLYIAKFILFSIVLN